MILIALLKQSIRMTNNIGLTIFCFSIALVSYGQKVVVIDGDKLVLSDSLKNQPVSLAYIERGLQNRDATWITYDRRPGVDPWIVEATDRSNRYAEDNFMNYLKARGINILGAITTFDNCKCAKCKTSSCPDMYLIHFKLSLDDWIKMKEFYPDIEDYLRTVKIQ
jgi:hypothetical protein